MRITFVRHGQTADNHGRKWQGWGGSGLDAEGREQAAALSLRLAGRSFDRVLSSDIERVVETAAHLGRAVELDPVWREIDVGSWAGRSIEETYGEHRDLFEAMRAGDDVRIGDHGESTHEFHHRIVEAVAGLVDHHGHHDEVLVLAHGGVIGTLVGEVFGTTWPASPTAPITNTSLTVLEVDDAGGWRLAVLNDASHLGPLPGFAGARHAAGDRLVTFVRHGTSLGNLADRWEGHACSGLADEGRRQAALLGRHLGPQPTLWSSDTPRAVETASHLGEPTLDPGLRELSFGSWEGLDEAAVEARDAELVRRIYRDRQDLPRGGNGESWADLTERVGRTVDGILDAEPGDVTMVSHGSAIRSVVLRDLGLGWDAVGRLALLPNTGLTRVIDTQMGKRLVDYGVAPHLEVEPGDGR